MGEATACIMVMKPGLVDQILRAWDLNGPMPQWKRTAIVCWRVIGIGFGLLLAYMMLLNRAQHHGLLRTMELALNAHRTRPPES